MFLEPTNINNRCKKEKKKKTYLKHKNDVKKMNVIVWLPLTLKYSSLACSRLAHTGETFQEFWAIFYESRLTRNLHI